MSGTHSLGVVGLAGTPFSQSLAWGRAWRGHWTADADGGLHQWPVTDGVVVVAHQCPPGVATQVERRRQREQPVLR